MAVWVALFLRTTFRLMQTTETFDVEGCFSSGKMAFHAPKIRYMLIYKEETMPTWNEMPFKANACVRLDFGAWRRLGNSGILNMFRHFAQEISAAILLPVYECETVSVSLTKFYPFHAWNVPVAITWAYSKRDCCRKKRMPSKRIQDQFSRAVIIASSASLPTNRAPRAHFFLPATLIAIISCRSHKCILMHSTLYKFCNTSSVPASLLTLVAFYADN